MNNISPSPIRELVLEKIKAGNAQMRPKWHFVLKATLAFVGLGITALAAVYLASLVIFIFSENGMGFLPGFGLHGILLLLFSLPWLIIVAGLVFIGLLEILVRNYSFAYRKPLFFSLLGIVVLIVLGSLVLERTSFHKGLSSRARMGRLPFAGSLYRGYAPHQSQHAHLGVVIDMTERGFIMEGPEGDIMKVSITGETGFPAGVDFQKGDKVFVFGDSDGDNITAFGVRRADKRFPGPMRTPGWYRPMMSPQMP